MLSAHSGDPNATVCSYAMFEMFFKHPMGLSQGNFHLILLLDKINVPKN